MLLVAVVVAGWVISVLARRHVLVATSLSPEHAAQVCDSKFSRGWRRVDGRGDLNYQARGIGSRSAPRRCCRSASAPKSRGDRCRVVDVGVDKPVRHGQSHREGFLETLDAAQGVTGKPRPGRQSVCRVRRRRRWGTDRRPGTSPAGSQDRLVVVVNAPPPTILT